MPRLDHWKFDPVSFSLGLAFAKPVLLFELAQKRDALSGALHKTDKVDDPSRESGKERVLQEYGTHFAPVLLEYVAPHVESFPWTKRPVAQRARSRAPRDKLGSELEAFEKQRDQLIPQYLGRFVAIHNGEVIDSDEDDFRLAVRVQPLARKEGPIAICGVFPEDEDVDDALPPLLADFESPIDADDR